MTIAVITPIIEEHHDILKTFDQCWGRHKTQMVDRTEVCVYREGKIVVALGGHGKVQFGVAAQHLLDSCQGISLVICAGVAGSLTSAIRVGDVVIGTATVEHDFNASSPNATLPAFDGSSQHIAALRQVSTSGDPSFRVHFGTIASGDEDVMDPTRASELHSRTGALAVAWEGAGGARAAAFSEVPFLEIRGISDMADHDFSKTWLATLPGAIRNVANVIVALAEGLDATERYSLK